MFGLRKLRANPQNEKIFANYVPLKGFAFRIGDEFLQLNNKKKKSYLRMYRGFVYLEISLKKMQMCVCLIPRREDGQHQYDYRSESLCLLRWL